MEERISVLAFNEQGDPVDILPALGRIVNGRRPVRFIKNIIEPGGPPVPIYPDGTFTVNQMPNITGTVCGSFCPVDGHHVPPTAEEMARYCGVSVEKYLAGLPATVAALNGQAAPAQPYPVDEYDPLADDWTERPANRAGNIGHLVNGKGPGRDAKRWATISAVVKKAHQKAAKAAAK